MSLRRIVSGVAATTVAAATWTLMPPASADPAFAPELTDVVGVGSDTTQIALNNLAGGYNAGRATGRLATFDAFQPGTDAAPVTGDPITVAPGVTLARPNGSGAGKGRLYGANNVPEIDFARSSSALNATEVSNNLFAFPFAKDTLIMSVSGTVASNAPLNLTPAQILDIYQGDITSWAAVGGAGGTIKPLIPQSGSGTRTFFLDQLKALNNGTDVVLGGAVTPVQEHSDAPIKADPNAIAPFSAGRSDLAGTLRTVGGWSAARAVYNVVRQASLTDTDIQAIFGSGGYVCSPAARPLIEAGGLEQLATPSAGGVCGEPTQAATATAQLVTGKVATSTAVAGASLAGGEVTLTATVGGATNPQGTVRFSLDGVTTPVATAVVQQGKAVATVKGLAPGTHSVVALFRPGTGTAFETSQSAPTAVMVKTGSTTSLAIAPAKGTWGAVRTVTATVASGSAVTGTVAFKVGSTTKQVALSGGKATMAVPTSTGAGKVAVTASYSGNASVAPSSASGSLAIDKAKAKVSEDFAKSVAKGAKAKGTVKVKVVGTSAKATGKLKIKLGKTVVGKGKLKKGKAKITLDALPKGKQKLTIEYAGNSNVNKAQLKFSITQQVVL